MKITEANCRGEYQIYLRNKRKYEVAQEYIKIYRNKRLGATSRRRKAIYYKKQKQWENKVIRLKRYLKFDVKAVQMCKRAGYL